MCPSSNDAAHGRFAEMIIPADSIPGWMPARDARMPVLIGTAPGEAAAAVRELVVVVLGQGAVGRGVAIALARMGVARLLLVDPAIYKPESLLTQPIAVDDVGEHKAASTARLCKQLSPGTRVFYRIGRLEDLDVADFRGVDAMVLATDNLRAEVAAAQLAVHLEMLLIHAAVHGESLTAQVRCFSNAGPDSPCGVCLYGAAEWSLVNRETRFSCEAAADARPAASTSSAPTSSVSALCALAADLATMQVLRGALGLGAPVADTMLEYNGYTHRTVISPLLRNPNCPVEHVTWARASASAPLPSCTPARLLRDAGFESSRRSIFQVEHMCFVATAICGNGHTQPFDRFVPQAAPIGRCRSCRLELVAHPLHAHRRAPEEVLRPLLDRPLGHLCSETPRWVVVQQGERAALFSQE